MTIQAVGEGITAVGYFEALVSDEAGFKGSAPLDKDFSSDAFGKEQSAECCLWCLTPVVVW